MKWSFASVGMIIIGLFGIVIIVLFHEITVSNEQDYYTLKEATEASMIEAVDSAYYRLTGKIKISEEKFVENFTKRFIQTSTFGQGNYYVDFYQITEYPAKVSLRIVDATNSYNIYTSFDESIDPTQTNIVNELSAILEGYEIDDYYDIVKPIATESSGPPPTINGCTSTRPETECNMTRAFREQIEVAHLSDRISIVITADGGCTVYAPLGSVEPIPYFFQATITCPSGYNYDRTSGWCVCGD